MYMISITTDNIGGNMGSSRRDFMKDAAVVGVVAATATPLAPENAHAVSDEGSAELDSKERCPYFDQPLLCDGKTDDGIYMCDG